MEKAELLQQIALFTDLTSSDLEKLSKIATEVTFGKGRLIFSEEDPGDSLYVINSGLVKVSKKGRVEVEDVIRDGLIGANLGFIIAVLAAGLVWFFEPFGAMPKVFYFFVVVVFTLFGAWVGGLTGIDKENKKLRRFHDDIEAGKYLILIYARKEMEQKIRDMMREKHPEARLAAVDRHFMNPFAGVRRRRRGGPPAGMRTITPSNPAVY